MYSFTGFLFVYLLGGITMVPLILAVIFLHAFLTLPTTDTNSTNSKTAESNGIKRAGDDGVNLKSGADVLADQFTRKHESDVAAGYFAVCREYVPAGVNGSTGSFLFIKQFIIPYDFWQKADERMAEPPERTTPSGETVAVESPSVYQSMYRSIFDRQQKPTIQPNKADGRPVKRARNVFFVVLRHGHLMLYDDSEQLDVRHVISLEHHDVSIYGGGEKIPEGDLWIKRNAICLTRNTRATTTPLASSLPFFLFSENSSEKEDFYFALLKNQVKTPGLADSPPVPQEYEVKDIIKLVQKLHSSEEHLQTRWLNALMGRLFLSMYKTPELEAFIRKRMTKKISRVKRPNFITKLVLQKIDLGEGAPLITNPRLKDLTVNGECTVEGDVNYSGKFRIEVAATARLDLGPRFKARTAELVLAVVVNKLEGHALIRFKPPPCNRVWVAFESMPNLDLKIEPIVSSRQITYNVILRAIESRIREVFAETLVLPFWDDIPFLDTSDELFRGGVWKRDVKPPQPEEINEETPEDEAEAVESHTDTSLHLLKTRDDSTLNGPHLVPSAPSGSKPRAGISTKTSREDMGQVPSGAGDRSHRGEPPRALRSSSFAAVAGPMVSPSHADPVASRRPSDTGQRKDAAQAMLKELSTKSINTSPAESPAGSPPNETVPSAAALKATGATLSKASNESLSTLSRRQQSELSSLQTDSPSSASRTSTVDSAESKTSSPREEHVRTSALGSIRSLASSAEKGTAINISSATNAAKNWGWGVLARNQQREREAAAVNSKLGTPELPMGRGRPLPPPGTPLPHPERSLLGTLLMSKRKVVPPHAPSDASAGTNSGERPKLKLAPRERRNQQSSARNDDLSDEVLVVEAPVDSNPSTPVDDEHHDKFFGHGEEANSSATAQTEGQPQLPRRRSSENKPPSSMAGRTSDLSN